MVVEVRPARAEDQAAILALVRSERLNPTGLDWRRFHVAEEDGALVGTVQIRPEGPELGSLAVRPDRRGRGLGGRLIEAKLAEVPGPVYVVVPAALARLYRRHGFAACPALRAPWHVAVNFGIGQFLGPLASAAKGRRPRRMMVMRRSGPY